MFKTVRTIVSVMLVALNAPAFAASFYCENGREPICLGYGQQVVGNNAVCFDRMKCGQEGFVCKSELNDLDDKNRELISNHEELVQKYNGLVDVYENNVKRYEKFVSCVRRAPTIDAARNCVE